MAVTSMGGNVEAPKPLDNLLTLLVRTEVGIHTQTYIFFSLEPQALPLVLVYGCGKDVSRLRCGLAAWNPLLLTL